MNKQFSTIVTNVGNEVGDTGAAFKAIIKPYVNARYFQILRAINWDCINPDYSFSTVAGQQDYPLVEDFGKPLMVRDSTNGFELKEVDLQWLASNYPDSISDSGTVERYCIIEDAVMAQPTSASVLTLVSSSASDTTQTVLVRGISDGAEITETVTLNGTTNVLTTNQFTRVKAISKSAATVGKITITSNSAAVTVAVISPEVTTAYFKKMRLHYVPTAILTISAPYHVKPLPLVNDGDYPVIDIADLIELGAKADAWRYKRQGMKANVFETLFSSGIADFVWDKENKPNMVNQFIPATYNRDNLY